MAGSKSQPLDPGGHMKVLITGGSGYLGQATIRALQRHGHQAVALARSDDADRVVTDLGATVVRGGLTDLDVLHKTAIDVDAAIHLAQHYGPDTAGIDLRATTRNPGRSRLEAICAHRWCLGLREHRRCRRRDGAPSTPPITAWRGANERRILERAGGGGHPSGGSVRGDGVYGHGGGLIGRFIGAPGRAGAAHYIGAGENRWAVVISRTSPNCTSRRWRARRAASTPALRANHRPCARSPRR